jgi:hypothetical protein
VLSAHGSFSRVKKGSRLVNRRRMSAIDGEIKLSKDIHGLQGDLERTIFILDSCDIGSQISAFRRAAGALAVVGFSESVDWVDSAAFILALLLHLQSAGIFHARRNLRKRIEREINRLREGPYKSLATALGLEVAFAPA